MPLTFRACVGPSANKTHIRAETETGERKGALTLCDRTVPSRDISGDVPHRTICIACLQAMSKLVTAEQAAVLTADDADTLGALGEMLGIGEIT